MVKKALIPLLIILLVAAGTTAYVFNNREKEQRVIAGILRDEYKESIANTYQGTVINSREWGFKLTLPAHWKCVTIGGERTFSLTNNKTSAWRIPLVIRPDCLAGRPEYQEEWYRVGSAHVPPLVEIHALIKNEYEGDYSKIAENERYIFEIEGKNMGEIYNLDGEEFLEYPGKTLLALTQTQFLTDLELIKKSFTAY